MSGTSTARTVKSPGPDHPITVTANPHRVRVIVGGHAIADTRAALTLREASYRPVKYIPREDVDMSRLERSGHTPTARTRASATITASLLAGDRSTNAVWTYEAPYDAVTVIKDHLAFYPDRVDLIEERAEA